MYNYLEFAPEKCDFVAIGPVQELGAGKRLYVEIDERQIVIINLAGNYYAIADVCSHDDGPLGDGNIEGFEIICPRHGARFDICTGKVLALPAFVDIPAYPVRVVDNQIEIGLPIEG